ncbi:hypothetical protein AOL_s00081g267 [Orbilia oligospora ATCC 24927]|uniref:DUF6589 domain-containing protein n=1 Tax=Arthrobotrys oligospora (strain ATCC 24927 / CBS 115.81 / DSM 1491) TaxID=756982 RepID=G1XFX4_ARTOA|nr:hypothetical protein AOL_s00081g267 [Orbilia oligospora ATCC 24927]EGX47940.1 hypothetical protein AOL_s00081g267 [Orbilia oligospora ATCC 24927]
MDNPSRCSGGRPTKTQIRKTTQQLQAEKLRVGRVTQVLDAIAAAGYSGIGSFLVDFLTPAERSTENSRFTTAQTNFLTRGGFVKVMNLALDDERCFNRNLKSENCPVNFLTRWCTDYVQEEATSFAYMKGTPVRRSQPTPSVEPHDIFSFEECANGLEKHKAPFLWSILSSLTIRTTRVLSDKDMAGFGGGDAPPASRMSAAVAFSILAYTSNPQISGLQSTMTIYLGAYRVPKKAMDVLHRMGMVASASQRLILLGELAKAEEGSLRLLANSAPCGVSVDNVDSQVAKRGSDQSAVLKSYLEHSCTGFVFKLRHIPQDYSAMSYLPDTLLTRGARLALTIEDMVPSNASWEYLREAIRYHLYSALDNRLGPFNFTKQQKENFRISKKYCFQCSNEPVSIKNFALLPFNQGEVKGTRAFLEHIQEKEMGFEPGALLNGIIPISADQLGLQRVQTNKIQSQWDFRGRRFDHYLPWPAPFHWRLNVTSTYLRLHGLATEESGDTCDTANSNPSSLAFANLTLRHGNLRKDLHNQERFISLALDGHILALATATCDKNNPTDIRGLLETCADKYQFVKNLVDKMTDQVYLKHIRELESLPDAQRDHTQESGLLLIFHGIMVRDLFRVIRAGDTGRLLLLAELFIPFFSGSGMNNYLYEFMDFKAATTKEYSSVLLDILKQNWLLNPSGLPGKFMAIDEFTEYIVRMLKDIYGINLTDKTENHRRFVISRLVVCLSRIKEELESVSGSSGGRSGHTSHPATQDVFRVASSLDGLCKTFRGRGRPQNLNIMDIGLKKLSQERIWKILMKNTLSEEDREKYFGSVDDPMDEWLEDDEGNGLEIDGEYN